MYFLLGRPIFRGHVSFRECNIFQIGFLLTQPTLSWDLICPDFGRKEATVETENRQNHGAAQKGLKETDFQNGAPWMGYIYIIIYIYIVIYIY